MRQTIINSAYVRDEVKRDCLLLYYVQPKLGEIEMAHLNDDPHDTIIGLDRQDPNRYVCLAVNGRITWSHGYKTIKAAIRNAYLI